MCIGIRQERGEGVFGGDGVCVYGGKVGEGGRGYIGGDGVCV